MNRLSLLLFSLYLTCLLPSLGARAEGGPILLGTVELQQIFKDLATKHSSLPQPDLEVSNFTAQPDSVELPPGALDFKVISTNQAKPLGQQVIVTDILVDGVVQDRVKLSGDLALYGEVVCAVSPIPRQSIITADQLKLVRRDLTMLGPGLVFDLVAAIGKEIKTTLRPGALLYDNVLKEPEMVKRNALVSILAASDSLTITVPGRVLTAGAKGELVKVKNLMSRREIFAKIIGTETVQAQF